MLHLFWIAYLLPFALAFVLADAQSRAWLAFVLLSMLVWLGVSVFAWRAWQKERARWRLLGLGSLVLCLGLYGLLSVFVLRPDLLPQHTWYDCIDNLAVTERLVDPALLKVESWEILGVERKVLFVHPAETGSTTLVYPLKVLPRSVFLTSLALAPEAWKVEGDGVVFSVFAENDAGMHLLYSRYVDPKHQEQDRRWFDVRIDLSEYSGQMVRLVLQVNSGPAGNRRFDWAGWGEPRLAQPDWP